jgi:hypothetical protein
MKCKLLTALALVLLSFAVSQAQTDSCQINIYDDDLDSLLSPTRPGDTIFTIDREGNPKHYQLQVSLKNAAALGGMSLGFEISSTDGVTWQYNSQVGGWGPSGQNTGHAAVTVIAGSRMDPPSNCFDMTQLLVNEKDFGGTLKDTVLYGGVSMMKSLAVGPMQPMIALHFTPGGVSAGQTKQICFDSCFVPPAGNFTFVDAGTATAYPPGIAPKICFPVGYEDTKGAGSGNPAVAFTYSLSQNVPNPFNPATRISYSVARKGHVNIAIFNILGQKVYTLVDKDVDPGSYDEIWPGTDEGGSEVASGIYFYRIDTDNFVQTRKMVLMR